MSESAKPAPVPIKRILHTIHAVRDCNPVRRKYEEVLGAWVFAERFHVGEDRDMALFYVANHMIEPMAPARPDVHDTTFSQYLAKFGESYHSFEVGVASAPETAAACEAHGMQLSTVYPLFFFVKPKSTGGIVVQVVGKPLVNDPYDYKNWNPDWIEGHPSTLRRLKHIGCIVRDIDLSLYFFTQVIAGEILSDERVTFPQDGRRVVFRLGDTNVLLFQADDPTTGLAGEYFSKPVSGIYTLVWEVDNLQVAERYLHDIGINAEVAKLEERGIAIPSEQMFGARHEFVLAEK